MLQTQRNKYLENSIQTATPAQLLIMLYDGAIRFCKLSIEAIKQANKEEANRCLLRAQDIISEFTITLDRKAEVADGLLKLYEYFNFRLTEGNLRKDTAPIEEVLGYLTELRETWISASKSTVEMRLGS